jgi:hypothetical protein
MAERVLHLIEHPDEAARMAERGRALPKEFDMHYMLRQQEEEYEKLLAGLSRSGAIRSSHGQVAETRL